MLSVRLIFNGNFFIASSNKLLTSEYLQLEEELSFAMYSASFSYWTSNTILEINILFVLNRYTMEGPKGCLRKCDSKST